MQPAGHNEEVIDKAELRRMSQAERRELASLLAELDEPDPPRQASPFRLDPALRRERRLALLVAAVFAELPLALLAFIGARRLLRATVAAAYRAGEGTPADETAGRRAPAGTRGCSVPVGQAHSLRHAPLAGQGIDEALPRSRAQRRAEQADRARQSA